MPSQRGKLGSVIVVTVLICLIVLACLLVILLGPDLGIGTAAQIALVIVILSIWPLTVLIRHVFSRRKRARAASRSGPQGSYQDLNRAAEEAVQWLRGTKLKTASSGDAIYQLPWFLIAGPPSSGKTSLVLSSGLDFHVLPSQRRADQNIVRPTRDCQWRVTDQAVLIDTTGRYQADGGDQDEWPALIEILKRYRRERPLDGFVISVAASSVLRFSENDIEQQAKTLRARLDTFSASAGCRVPVYIVFTGIDAIEGFEDFFGSLDAGERAEPWGATIPLEQSPRAHALFDVEFDYLYDALMRRRLVRLAETADSREQLHIFDFPLRFGEARRKLGLYTSALFRPNPFSESPLLRGFYFASASGPRQAASQGDGTVAQVSGDSFFTRRLFSDVLLRDKHLAESFLSAQERPHLLRSSVVGVAAALILVAAVGMLISFFANRALIAEALDDGLKVDGIMRADGAADVSKKEAAASRVEIEADESLREFLSRLDDYDRNSPPFSLRFGLYQGDAVSPYLRTLYFESISKRFFGPVAAAIERDLKAFGAGGTAAEPSGVSGGNNSSQGGASPAAVSLPQGQDQDLGRYYDLLKTYLMMGMPARAEASFLTNQLVDYWEKCSPPDLEALSLEQLKFYAAQASRGDAPHRKPDDTLVAGTRHRLAAYPPVNRVFKQITTEIDSKVDQITLETVLQGRGQGILSGSYSVPGSFTITGYRDHMVGALESAAEEMSKDDWVMASAAGSSQSLTADVGKLREMYFRSYAAEWQRFVGGISVRPFKSKDDAAESLKVLSANDSPMAMVMTAVAQQTNLSAEPVGGGLLGWLKSLFPSRTIPLTGGKSDVEREFQPVFDFVSAEGKNASALSEYRATLRSLVDPLESSSQDQLAAASKALMTGKDDIGIQKAELSVSKLVDSFKTASAADVAALLKQPVVNLKMMLYGGGYEQIERTWREQLFPKAHALESGYPFTDLGDAPVTDLSRYLNPVNGQLTAFFNESLAPSFDDAQGQWRLKESGAFRFSDDFVNYLNSARRLRDALFSGGGQQIEVDYEITLQPVANSDVLIQIDGNSVEARGSAPVSSKFIWPAKSGASGARIAVIPSNGQSAEKSFPGDWGLFKMFAAGSPAKTGDNQFQLTWNIGSSQVKASLRPSSSASPFQRSMFTDLHAPPSLGK